MCASRRAIPAVRCPSIDRQLFPITALGGKLGDWLCVAGVVATAVAATMLPFVLLLPGRLQACGTH